MDENSVVLTRAELEDLRAYRKSGAWGPIRKGWQVDRRDPISRSWNQAGITYTPHLLTDAELAIVNSDEPFLLPSDPEWKQCQDAQAATTAVNIPVDKPSAQRLVDLSRPELRADGFLRDAAPAYVEYDPETQVFCAGCRSVINKVGRHFCPQSWGAPDQAYRKDQTEAAAAEEAKATELDRAADYVSKYVSQQAKLLSYADELAKAWCCETAARTGGVHHTNSCPSHGNLPQEAERTLKAESNCATLRDRLAMAALTGFCANNVALTQLFDTHPEGAMTEGAAGCYRWADAMLEARKEKA